MSTINTKVITSLVSSHQARMRCVIHKFMFGDNVNDIDGEWDDKDDYITEDEKLPGFMATTRQQLLSRPADLNAANLNELNSDAPLLRGGRFLKCFGKSCGNAKVNPKNSMHRFMNASVVKIEVTSSAIEISLIYNGNIGDDERKPKYIYYTIPGTTEFNDRVKQNHFQVIPFMPVIIPNNGQFDVNNNEKYVFYIMRHGQGVHNKMGTLDKLKNRPTDADLTDLGMQQAADAGRGFGKRYPNLSFDYLFASDLRRTRDTLNIFLGASPELQTNNNLQDIIVLPCSHELDYKINKNTGSCDGMQSVTPFENTSSCLIGDCKQTRDRVLSSEQMTIQSRAVNWDFYNKFYGDGTRKKHGSKNAGQCRYTNMLESAISIIKMSQSAVGVGGYKKSSSRKRKYTRKRSRKCNCHKKCTCKGKCYCKGKCVCNKCRKYKKTRKSRRKGK